MKNIFVGNLDFNTSEEELRQMFEAHGQVDRVSIMTDRDTGRSRGFGFVEMTNAEEGDKAIAALNGTQVGGRTLNVNEARPKVERGGGGGVAAGTGADAAAAVAAGVAISRCSRSADCGLPISRQSGRAACTCLWHRGSSPGDQARRL